MAKNTRVKIVEKAEQLLWLQGYQATSLNDVVEKAGVSKGAFFHYYSSKQAMADDVIHKYAREQLSAPLTHALGKADSVKEGLQKWIEGYFEAYKKQNFKGGCLMGNMALELADQSESARDILKMHFLDLENTLCSALKPIEAEGQLNMEARQFARLLLSAVQGMTMMTKVHKDQNRAGREFTALIQLIDLAITA